MVGLVTLASTAPKASANPLQAIPVVSDLIRATQRPPAPPSNVDIFHDNVQGNTVNLCVLTCNTPNPGIPQAMPQRVPQAVPQRMPQGAMPQRMPQSAMPQRVPQGAVPQRAPQGARPTTAAPRSNRPNVTVDLSPINIPL